MTEFVFPYTGDADSPTDEKNTGDAIIARTNRKRDYLNVGETGDKIIAANSTVAAYLGAREWNAVS